MRSIRSRSPKKNRVGRVARPTRFFLGLLLMLRSGARWREVGVDDGVAFGGEGVEGVRVVQREIDSSVGVVLPDRVPAFGDGDV